MKKLFAIALMSSFIAIAVFGVFTMNMDHDESHSQGAQGRCLAETAARTDCPKNNIFDAANFLLNIFKSFTTAHVVSPLLGILLASFLLTAVWLSAFSESKKVSRIISFLQQKRNFYAFLFSPKLRVNHWLALLENSPSAL